MARYNEPGWLIFNTAPKVRSQWDADLWSILPVSSRPQIRIPCVFGWTLVASGQSSMSPAVGIEETHHKTYIGSEEFISCGRWSPRVSHLQFAVAGTSPNCIPAGCCPRPVFSNSFREVTLVLREILCRPHIMDRCRLDNGCQRHWWMVYTPATVSKRKTASCSILPERLDTSLDSIKNRRVDIQRMA
jgi:hypothetical protein